MVCSYSRFVSSFYPRPPRGGRPGQIAFLVCTGQISIHALREEGDRPCGNSPRQQPVFLSTPSARRATSRSQTIGTHTAHFYPRPPRGGRLTISSFPLSFPRYFYPRPPRGGRPPSDRLFINCGSISIHALREEGDRLLSLWLRILSYFYPRPPRGGRLPLLTLLCIWCCISIHALREEGDPATVYPLHYCIIFLSTPSARRATRGAGKPPLRGVISIHALREEGDPLFVTWDDIACYISIHALREEGDIAMDAATLTLRARFLSTPSARRATVSGCNISR